MLGGNQGCGGPVSWWCSEVWRCSPRVSPGCATTSAKTPDMADCDQCNGKFSILKRKRVCSGCNLVFCSSCIKRGLEGARRCNKCLVLSQWPLDTTQVEALRVKDLRHFLNTHHINTVTCTEKRDLIDLVTRHICSQHGAPGGSSRFSTASFNYGNPANSARDQPQYKPATSPVTRDDGIRVRPCNSTPENDINSMGSIRVRPMDSIRVRPGRPMSPDSNDYDPDSDLGIRVFASDSSPAPEQRASSISPVSAEGCSESAEEECSRCPSEDCTTSCCSLDSCNGASSQPCPHKADHSSQCSLDVSAASSEGRVPSSTSPDLPTTGGRPNSLAQDNSIHNTRLEEGSSSSSSPQSTDSPSEVPTDNAAVASSAAAAAAAADSEAMDVDPTAGSLEEQQPPPAATSPSSASSSTFPSESSSPEPIKPFGIRIVSLGDLRSEEDIRRLTIRQCKELLAFHRVNLSGVREKSELTNKIIILWKDYQSSHQDVEDLPEEMVCKICMDSMIDCVLLECGHMVSCTQCGKQMAECPVCRQFVVRVVRTFRA